MELTSQSSMCVEEEEEKNKKSGKSSLSHIYSMSHPQRDGRTPLQVAKTRDIARLIRDRRMYQSSRGRARDVTILMSPPRPSGVVVVVVVVVVVAAALHHIAVLMMR